MKLYRSIISDLSLVAAVSTLFVGTARADDTLAPTESPSSWFPSSYPFDFEYDPYLGCPDRHSGLLLELYETFGSENCVRETLSDTTRTVECEYVDPNWVRGYALYQYTDSDVEYHVTWRPESVIISETILYGPSGIVFIDFRQPQPPSFTGTCLDPDGSAFLSSIRSKRLFPQNAPTCDDTEGEFSVTIGRRARTVTCDDLWNKSWRTRYNGCGRVDELVSKCPGVCSKYDEFSSDSGLLCICKNNPFLFGRQYLACADLEGLDGDALSEKCDLSTYLNNCPRICDPSCASGF